MNSKLIVVLLALFIVNTLSQTCFGFSANNTAVCSAHGACVAQDLCSCFSGFDGSQCERQASQTSCTWNVNSQTKTDFYPVIDSASLDFVADNLVFSIKAPLVADRLNSIVYIGDESLEQCKFPGQHSTNSLDLNAPCFNRFNYRLPWNVGKNCGWTVREETEQMVYTGNIFIKQVENIGYIRGEPIQRNILRVIPIEVRFQTQVEVSTKVKVFAPVNMVAAVTKQAYIAGPPSSGLFEILSSLQYPFVIDVSKPYTMTGAPTGLIASIFDISQGAECVAGQPCTQRFRIPLTINGACSFTGDYEASFKLACHPSITNPADCPLQSNNNDARIVISANSENFCTAASVDIKLTGSLTSFSDATYLVQKNAYLMDSRAYFQAKVFSPKATLKSSTVVRAQWTAGNLTQVLYDNQAVTPEGTTEGYQLGPNGAYTAAFSFMLKPEWMSVPIDGNSNFNVSALIKVQYEAIDGTTSNQIMEQSWKFSGLKNLMSSQKPQLESGKIANSQDSKYSNTIQLFGGRVGTSSAASVRFSLAGILLIFLYWIM